MNKTFTHRSLTMLLAVLVLSVARINAQSFTENFDDITTLAGGGWVQQNNSTPVGTSGWFQGNTLVLNSFNGAANSYIGANFNNTTGSGDISNWLISPNRTFRNGDVIQFYTRTITSPLFPDRLELRLSTSGSSTNVGSGAAAVGDFTTLLLSINPTLATATGYPSVWTQFTATISGLSAATSGRFALRYFVTFGGPSGDNSDYIGIDNVIYSAIPCPVITVLPASLPNGTAGVAYNQTISQTGGVLPVDFTVSSGSLPAGLTLAPDGTLSGTPTASGTSTFTVLASDLNDCNGEQTYNLTIDCPVPNTTLTVTPSPICNYPFIPFGPGVVLGGGSPAGGVYSGNGVSGGSFDPSFGTQTITYTYTDGFGCVSTATDVLVVNQPPVVNLGGPYTACGTYTLNAGNAGSTYAWSDGLTTTQTFTATSSNTYSVTVTDANTCSASGSADVTINAAPTFAPGTNPAVCKGTTSASLDFTTTNTDPTPVPLFVQAGGAPNGWASQNFEVAFDAFDNQGADDFTVPAATTWNIDQVSISGLYYNGFGPASSYNVTFYADAAGLPGAVIASFTNVATFVGSPSPAITLPSTVSVGTGTYWVSVQANMDFNVGGQFGWNAYNGAAGNVAVWQNPGDGFGTGCSSYGPMTSCLGAAENNFVFSLFQNCQSTYTINWNGAALAAGFSNVTDATLPASPLTITVPAGAAPATYTGTVTVTNCNGCVSAPQAFTVTVNALPAPTISGALAFCAGNSTTLDAGAGYANYSWSTTETAQTISVNTAATFTVTVTDANTCTGSATATTIVNPLPTVNLGGPYVACVGPVVLDAGNAGSTYVWSDGLTTTQTLSVSTSGTYSVTVTDVNTCSNSASADVTIHLPPLNHTGYTICQGLSVPAGDGLTATGCGNVSTSFDGTTSLQDPTFNRSQTGTTYNASQIGTDVHYTTHTFSVGTTGSYTFAMCGSYDTYLHIYDNSLNTAFPATNFLVADDDGNNANCGSGSLATITLTAGVSYLYVATGFDNFDVGNYTVTFTGPGPVYEGPLNEPLWFSQPVGGPLLATAQLYNPVGTPALPNTNVPGTYTFYSACPNTPDCRTPITFVVNPSPSVNLGGPYNQCGGSVTLDAGAGNTTYTWSDGASSQTTTATTSGSYNVTVVNSFNCSATGSVEVYIQTVPVVNLGLDHTQCGGTVTLDAGNPGNQFLWSDNSGNQTLTVSLTGTYSVTVGDINTNCTATDDVSVTINNAPVVDLGNDVVQCGGTVTLDAGNAGATYLWSDNSTGQTLTVSASGIYRVTVTNSNSCTGTGSVNITINSYPVIGADKTDSVCPGYTVDLNTYYANSYATYVWNTGNPSAVGAGVYELIVTNAAGCADSATVSIVNRQQPNLGADVADSICIGYTYDLWTRYPPSPAYATYVWNTPTPQAVVAGTYTLIVTNHSGCSDTLNAVITYGQQPNLGADKADSVCMGYTLDLTTYYPNTGYATYVWNTATPDSVGAGVYTLIVTYTSGCADTAVMTVTYRQQPVVTLNMPLAMCYTEPEFALTGGMPAGGIYNIGDSLNVDTFNAVHFGIGTYHITYIYTNASGCTDSASIDFTVHPQPHIVTVAAPDLCTGSSPMNLNNYFTPHGGVYTGFGISQNYFYPALTGAGNDTITYYYTDQFGCKDTSVYPLSVKNSVKVSLVSSDVDFTICRGDDITFTASGAQFYQFFINGAPVDTPTLSNVFTTNTLGNHDAVSVVGSNSCSTDTSESIIIDVITLPTVDAGPDTTIALGEIVHLHTTATGTGLLLYNWTPNYWLNFANVPNPTYSGPDTVTFEVRVTDTYGCWGADSITINVYVPDNVLLPNILTPNGDGKNDLWRLNYKINLDGSNLVIFNRWGETVYEAENYANNWDGTYKATGKMLPDDTYYYVLKVPAQNNHIYKGAINILNGTAK